MTNSVNKEIFNEYIEAAKALYIYCLSLSRDDIIAGFGRDATIEEVQNFIDYGSGLISFKPLHHLTGHELLSMIVGVREDFGDDAVPSSSQDWQDAIEEDVRTIQLLQKREVKIDNQHFVETLKILYGEDE